MPHHVIVDGSNLATEGRTLPSLHQLNDAVAAYRDDHPDTLVTVVVDATFGHRIDPKEVPEFEKAIETNAFVAPPAGAVGRGDGFILSIAQKAGASILSNDSYQEFHGEYAWLFDEGRLIGGKPVPHVGWVFVNRVPVRGPISRRSVKEQKIVDKSPGRGRGRKSAAESLPAISADGPMPVPKSPPPGAVMAGAKPAREPRAGQRQSPPKQPAAAVAAVPNQAAAGDPRSTAARSTNDLMPFLTFVEHFPVGTAVTAVVESYSSHGAYVSIGDAKGYVPLRLMADPAPRSARKVMAIGETVTLVVNSFEGARRSIDLAVPAMAPPAPPVAAPKARKAAGKKAAAGAARLAEAGEIAAEAIGSEAVEASSAVEADAPVTDKPSRARPTTKKKAAASGRGRASASATAADSASAEVASQPTFDTVFDEPVVEPSAPDTVNLAPPESQPASATPAKPAKASRGRRSPAADAAPAADGAAAPAAAAPTAATKRRAGSRATKAPASSDAAPATSADTSTTSERTASAADSGHPDAPQPPAKTTATKRAASTKRAATKAAATPAAGSAATKAAPAKAAARPSKAAAAATDGSPAKKSGGRRRVAATEGGA